MLSIHVFSWNNFTNQLLDLEVISSCLILSIKVLFVLKNMSSSRKPCVIDPNGFCYICGKFCLQKQRRKITEFVKKAYQAHFGRNLAQKNKYWVPNIVCKSCVESLRYWSQGVRKGLQFGVPMIWTEPTNHFNDCYFCAVNVKGMNRYKRRTWVYPNVESAKPPVLHSDAYLWWGTRRTVPPGH